MAEYIYERTDLELHCSHGANELLIPDASQVFISVNMYLQRDPDFFIYTMHTDTTRLLPLLVPLVTNVSVER